MKINKDNISIEDKEKVLNIAMKSYENDTLTIPKRYKKMSAEQLQRRSEIVLKISKLLPRKKKKVEPNSNIKFYL